MTYRLVILSPDDEVLDTIVLDGTDLTNGQGERAYLGELVLDGMGRTHAVACAALPEPDEDEL